MRDDMPLLGFGLPVSGSWATPSTMLRVAGRAEELGYASLWTFQRVLYPAAGGLEPSYDAAHDPAARPADDPSYRAVHDPLLPLAYVAGHTARMDEYLRCLEALWTQDPVEFASEFYTVPRSHTALKPVQRPHPPVLLGGAAPRALRRAGRLAEGWISSTRHDLSRIAHSVELVREGAREVGRDPEAVRIVVRALVDLVDEDPGKARQPFHGTREQVFDDLSGLRAQGVTEVFFDLNFSPRVDSPAVDAVAAASEAEEVLNALAPAHLSG